jgi:RND superfamily putative drug exporter
VVILAILFGLSMDYQVFLVSRMAEEWGRTGDSGRSVRAGQTETARVITAAASIMIAVFVAFVFMSQRDVAEFGIGLGRANWWLPGWLDRRLPRLAIEPPSEPAADRVPVSAGHG